MPASIAGRGDATQQSTVSQPDPLQFRRFLRPIGRVHWSRGGAIEGEPLMVWLSESECLSPFADDEERPGCKDRALVSGPGGIEGRGDGGLDLMLNAQRGGGERD